MLHKIIAVDCDEVLSETLDAAFAFHNYQFKDKKISKQMMTNFYFHKMPEFEGTEEYETLEFFLPVLASEEMRDIKPVPGALEKLTQRKNEWRILKVVTWRSSKRKEATTQRIETHFPDIFSEIHFAEHLTDQAKHKSEICQEIWATVIIEDNLDYCMDTANADIHSILLDKPRNQDYSEILHEGIEKVKNWEDIKLQ